MTRFLDLVYQVCGLFADPVMAFLIVAALLCLIGLR
jgi:hypothetical protein